MREENVCKLCSISCNMEKGFMKRHIAKRRFITICGLCSLQLSQKWMYDIYLKFLCLRMRCVFAVLLSWNTKDGGTDFKMSLDQIGEMEYEWHINNFSSLRHKCLSDAFEALSYKWCAITSHKTFICLNSSQKHNHIQQLYCSKHQRKPHLLYFHRVIVHLLQLPISYTFLSPTSFSLAW